MTTDVDVRRGRTAAATAARRRAHVAKLAMDLACRLDEIEDAKLTALTGLLLAECDRRMLPPADPDALPARPL